MKWIGAWAEHFREGQMANGSFAGESEKQQKGSEKLAEKWYTGRVQKKRIAIYRKSLSRRVFKASCTSAFSRIFAVNYNVAML